MFLDNSLVNTSAFARRVESPTIKTRLFCTTLKMNKKLKNQFFFILMGNFHNRLHFELGKIDGVSYYSWKEDPKISKNAKFGFEIF